MTRSHGLDRPRRAVCNICGEPTGKPTRMCADCTVSYDKHAHDDGSIIEVIGWAARRARWYEQRRKSRSSNGFIRLTLAELEHLRDFAHNVDDPDHDAWWEQLDKKLTVALRSAREAT
jgi:hypothetical protein